MPYGGTGNVNVLADKYGRVLVEHVEDGDYYQCVAWLDGDARFDFDSASDTELVDLMKDRGFVEGLTIGENLDVTVNIGGLTETYVWSDVSMEFGYDFDSWINGSRTLATKWFAKSDGTPELVVVDTASETPVYYVDSQGNKRCLVVEYPGEAGQYFGLDLISEHAELTSWHSVECYESTAPGEGMATLNIVNFGPDDNIFVITINEDGAYRDGSARLPIVKRLIAEIFANQECTEKPAGILSVVFVKTYFPISDDSEWGVHGVDSLRIFKWDEDSNHWWQVNWLSDFDQVLTASSSTPLQPNVYRVNGNPEGDTTNKVTKYYADGSFE